MALADYNLTATGGIRAPKRSKKMILANLKKAAKSPQEMGLSKSQREQITDEAKVEATQAAKEAAQDVSQAGLAGGGYTGQKAEVARQSGKAAADASGAASAGAQQLSQQIAKLKYDQYETKLKAQQERASRNAQFWSQQGINMARGISAAAEPLMNLAKGG